MNEREREYHTLLRESKNIGWNEKSTKEKLDFVFVCVAIITFSLGAVVHIKNLTQKK